MCISAGNRAQVWTSLLANWNSASLHSIGSSLAPRRQHAPTRPPRESHEEHLPALLPHDFQHPPSRLHPLQRGHSLVAGQTRSVAVGFFASAVGIFGLPARYWVRFRPVTLHSALLFDRWLATAAGPVSSSATWIGNFPCEFRGIAGTDRQPRK